MRYSGRELIIVMLLTAGSLTAASLLTRQTLSYAPLPVLLPLLLAWIIPHPARYLVPLAIISELLTPQLPGVLTLTILTPLLIRRATPRRDVDISVRYVLTLAATVLLQLLILIAPDLIRASLLHNNPALLFVQLPWRPLLWATLTTTSLAAITTIALANLWPLQAPRVISLDSSRLPRNF